MPIPRRWHRQSRPGRYAWPEPRGSNLRAQGEKRGQETPRRLVGHPTLGRGPIPVVVTATHVLAASHSVIPRAFALPEPTYRRRQAARPEEKAPSVVHEESGRTQCRERECQYE